MPHNRWEGNLRPIELMKMTYLMLSERESENRASFCDFGKNETTGDQ